MKSTFLTSQGEAARAQGVAALRPDFFIVGAPKCGTTSLNEYLRRHPEIFIPARKELHYFGSDLQLLKAPRPTLPEYLSHFEIPASTDATPAPRCAGEASVWYLYSKLAAEEIKAFQPRAKIIIMLRNPIEMLQSLHGQFLYESNEDLTDFREALAAEPDRRRGRRIPDRIYFPSGLQYRAVARYAEQVRRYLDLFGRENVLLVEFDDFSRHTPRVYEKVLRFLGVDPAFRCEFEILNSNKRVKSFLLQSFLNNPSPFALAASRWLVPTRLRHALVDLVKRFNSQKQARSAMDAHWRKELAAEVAPSVAELKELLLEDFPTWLDWTPARSRVSVARAETPALSPRN